MCCSSTSADNVLGSAVCCREAVGNLDMISGINESFNELWGDLKPLRKQCWSACRVVLKHFLHLYSLEVMLFFRKHCSGCAFVTVQLLQHTEELVFKQASLFPVSYPEVRRVSFIRSRPPLAQAAWQDLILDSAE